jgi:CBS domain-containing protein
MTVETLLKRKGQGVVTIEAGTPVGAAIRVMRQRNVGALVVSRNGRDIEGLVREHDLIRALKSHGVGRLMPMTVADIMCRSVATCRPEEDLRRVMTRMSARRTQHMPVVDNRGLCGIVSLGEIIEHRLGEAEQDAAAVCEAARIPGMRFQNLS